MRSDRIRGGPNQVTSIFIRERRMRFGDRDAETQAHRDEGQVKTEAEPGVMLPKPRNARIFSKHQKL